MSTNSDRRPRLPVRIAYLAAGVLFVAAMLLLASVVNPDRDRDFSMNHVPRGRRRPPPSQRPTSANEGTGT